MDVLKGSITKNYLHFLLPTLLASISSSLYCLADVFFIAQGSGAMGLAALNICMPIFTIYSAIGLWIGVGCASLLSIAYGQRNDKMRNQAFTLGIYTLSIISILVCILGLIFRKPLLFLFGSDASLYALAESYFIPIHMGACAFIMGYAMPIFLRNDFVPKKAMIFTLAGNILNIFLDYVFVMVFHLGLQGAAIATSISSFCGLCMMASHFFSKDCTLKLVKHPWDVTLMKRMLSAGSGASVLELSVSIANLVFNHFILACGGALDLAAYSIITNIAFVTKGLFNGFAQASQPLISSNYGANQMQRVKQSLSLAITVAMSFALILYLSFLWKAELWASIFASNDGLLIEKAALGIRIYFISILPNALMCILLSYLQACEHGKLSAILAGVKGCVIVVVLIQPFVTWWGMNGIYALIPCSEFLGVILAIYGIWRSKDEFSQRTLRTLH